MKELFSAFGSAGRPRSRPESVPDYVLDVDTFVSSDSPLASQGFGDALLGKGFVVRAVDNSNIVPRQLVSKVLALAKAGQIPAQYGVTGSSNDGSVFLPFGSIDIALGWPLRYSHLPRSDRCPRNLHALAKIIDDVARTW